MINMLHVSEVELLENQSASESKRESNSFMEGNEGRTGLINKPPASTNLRWLIEIGAISNMEDLRYLSKKNHAIMGTGKATAGGVLCDCCGATFTLSKFEAHLGSTCRRPAQYLFLADGRSLQTCNKRAFEGVDGDGSKLAACERSTPNKRRKIVKALYPESTCNRSAQNLSLADEIGVDRSQSAACERPTPNKRKIRVVKALYEQSACNRPAQNLSSAAEIGVDRSQLVACESIPIQETMINETNVESQDQDDDICTSCNQGGDLIICDACSSVYHLACAGLESVPDGNWFCPPCRCVKCGEAASKDSSNETIFQCSQCQRKYHETCWREDKTVAELANMSSVDSWCCSAICSKIHAHLLECTGQPKPTKLEGVTWTMWRHEEGSSNKKLKRALHLLHECFYPVKDKFTRRDLIKDVIFNQTSTIHRLNFNNFYTVTLEKGQDVISVATIRIHSNKAAELPFIATSLKHRNKGMCRVLMTELEKMVVGFGVERMILPSIPDCMNTWTNAFGFSVMKSEDMHMFPHFVFMNFEGSIMLHKILKPLSNLEPS